ncbi:MAG: lipoyl synthase, partial [Gemmatimonadetes bacterium]|nr:lipoyl synthase [Gemmatimonadota bacterium]
MPARKPSWLKVKAPGGAEYLRIQRLMRDLGLHTVCEEARCPNIGECWRGGTATFMLLGDTCTRACAFCAVKTGNPRGAVDPDEPRKLAESVRGLGLRYVVLTTVDLDDLEDGGARHFAAAIRAIREAEPAIRIETLTGDFRGDEGALRALLEAAPDVFAHNIETVERLTPTVRDRKASYAQSLEVLRRAGELRGEGFTKSSLMVGVGEREDELVRAMSDLRDAGVDLLTIGQYLRPTPRHLPVAEYVTPERFERLRERGLRLGFRHVASGPLVRSSYHA